MIAGGCRVQSTDREVNSLFLAGLQGSELNYSGGLTRQQPQQGHHYQPVLQERGISRRHCDDQATALASHALVGLKAMLHGLVTKGDASPRPRPRRTHNPVHTVLQALACGLELEAKISKNGLGIVPHISTSPEKRLHFFIGSCNDDG